MIPEGFANTPTSRTDMPVEVIGGGRYLRVDQSANLRANSVISKIWNHGFEYRSLDHGLRDKYWRCKYYRVNKLFKVTGAGNTNISHVIRHLKKKQPVSFGQGREESDEEEDDEDNALTNSISFLPQRLSFLIWKVLIPGWPTRPGREVPAWVVRPVGSTAATT
jgi:hypothetical protein